MRNNQQKQKQEIMLQQQTYQAPIPMASEFKSYDETLPGAADRILKMTETQADHRQEIEKRLVKHNIIQSYIGLIFGIISVVICIGASVYLALNNSQAVAGIIAGTTIVSITTIFVIGKNKPH